MVDELEIRGNYGTGEILGRLEQAAKRTTTSRSKFTKLLFVRVTFDDRIVRAVQDLFSKQCCCWERVVFSMCQGLIQEIMEVVAKANSVAEFQFLEQQEHLGDYSSHHHHQQQQQQQQQQELFLSPPRPSTSGPFQILSSANLRRVFFENMGCITREQGNLIGQFLAFNDTLDTFSLFHCSTMDQGTVKELADGFSSNRCLTTVRISHCLLLDDEDLACMLQGIIHNPQLQRLFLDGNRCGDKSLNAISSLLQQEKSSLLELDVSHQESGLATSSLLPSVLSELRKNKSLKALRMRHNNLTDDHLRYISKMLCQESSTIVDVDLRFNAFTTHGIQAILSSDLALYSNLRRLQIRTGSGVMRKNLLNALQKGMEHNWKLLSLDLFEWERSLQYWVDLNRSQRVILRDEAFPLSLWPWVLERTKRVVERTVPAHLRGNKLRTNLEDRKASILFYFLRNSSSLIRS